LQRAFLPASILVFGSAAERELCHSVAAAIPGARNLAGETSLAEFIDLAAACSLFLTNDSGAMHIASALGVPTVTVFGATTIPPPVPAAASRAWCGSTPSAARACCANAPSIIGA
jgi:heptosyltransferase-2